MCFPYKVLYGIDKSFREQFGGTSEVVMGCHTSITQDNVYKIINTLTMLWT